MKQYVFVYGTLKEGYGNHRLLNRAKFVGPGVTVSGDFKMLDGGFPMVLTGGLFHIKGELYEVSDQETLSNLDRLEGVPHLFNRHSVQVDTPEGVHDAFMYVGNSNFENRYTSYVVPNENNQCEWK